jgi:hypothetical protein
MTSVLFTLGSAAPQPGVFNRVAASVHRVRSLLADRVKT